MLILIHITFTFLFSFSNSLFFFFPLGNYAVWFVQRTQKLFGEDGDKRSDDLGETLTKYLPRFIINWSP